MGIVKMMAPCIAVLSILIGFVHMKHFLIETETKDSKEFGTDYADTKSEDGFDCSKESEKNKNKVCSGQTVIGKSIDNDKKTGKTDHSGNTENPQDPEKYRSSEDTNTSDSNGDIYDEDNDSPRNIKDTGDAEITGDSKDTKIEEKNIESPGNSGSIETDGDSEDTDEEPDGYQK